MDLKKNLTRLARKSGFVRRKGKLSAYEFVVLMTVGQLALKHPSLAAMVQAIEAKISREALHQRYTPQADTGEFIELGEMLRRYKGNGLEWNVLMGSVPAEQTPCRLICLRVSEQAANARRRRMRRNAQKKGRTVSQQHLALCDWTRLITHVPSELLPAMIAYDLYRVRWQIELLFKQFKSILRIHQSDTRLENRLLCELYGKLIMAVLIHRVHGFVQGELWHSKRKEVRFDKLHKRFQERAFLLLREFLKSLKAAGDFLCMEIPRMLGACFKAHQRSRQTTLQRLDQPLETSA